VIWDMAFRHQNNFQNRNQSQSGKIFKKDQIIEVNPKLYKKLNNTLYHNYEQENRS